MSQEQILEILKEKKDEWLDSIRLSEIMQSNRIRVCRNLKMLRKFNEVNYRTQYRMKARRPTFMYQYKELEE